MMKILQTLLILVAVLASTGSRAGSIPADCDQWTEYSDANAAQMNGWIITCGISQLITVSNERMVGSMSAGCRTTRAYWCDEFGIEKEVSLETATGIGFWHKTDLAGWNFYLRIYMQPTSSEAADGVTVKRLTFNFPSSTTWVHNSFQFEDGQWEWRVDNMWQTNGHEETLTELVSIQWYSCRYYGVSIGDEFLIDGLCFQTSESAVPDPEQVIQLLAPAPNPFNPATYIRFVMASSQRMEVAIYTVEGKLVKILGERIFEPGLQQIPWNGCDAEGRAMPAGVYLVRIVGEGLQRGQKLVLVR